MNGKQRDKNHGSLLVKYRSIRPLTNSRGVQSLISLHSVVVDNSIPSFSQLAVITEPLQVNYVPSKVTSFSAYPLTHRVQSSDSPIDASTCSQFVFCFFVNIICITSKHRRLSK